MNFDHDENLSPGEKAAQIRAKIATRQRSGQDAKNLIFSPDNHEDRQVELSRAAQLRRQKMARERQAKNHLIRNRQALKEKQQHNKRSSQEKERRESMKLQQQERKKQELYGGVKSRVFDQDYAVSKPAVPTHDESNNNFSLSSVNKSYGKVPKYIANRKSMLERERWDVKIY